MRVICDILYFQYENVNESCNMKSYLHLQGLLPDIGFLVDIFHQLTNVWKKYPEMVTCFMLCIYHDSLPYD